MCTSFIGRNADVLIAMNFDNNGMAFDIHTKDPNQFVVYANGGRGKVPSFGVNHEGTFINHLLVDSNGKGLYKRRSKSITHTSKLVEDVLSGVIPIEDLDNYLDQVEVVNVPDYSAHSMICDRVGNVWVVEPGRGIIRQCAQEAPYFVMTNFSLCDYQERGSLAGSGVDRYQVANELLAKSPYLDVDRAFHILEATKQSDGEWTTAFSMVFSQKEKTVYYCFDGDFTHITKHTSF